MIVYYYYGIKLIPAFKKMSRPSDKAILCKLRNLKKSAEDHGMFNVAAKFEIRIQKHKNKKHGKK